MVELQTDEDGFEDHEWENEQEQDEEFDY